MSRLFLGLLSAAVFLIGSIVIWNLKVPLPMLAGSASQKQGESWQQNQLPKRDIDGALHALADRSPWLPTGKTAATKSDEVVKPLTPPDWHIAGVVKQASGDFILLSVVGQPTTQVMVGEALPGGARILAIEQDHICLLVNGKRRKLRIYTE